jgi:hypothetical protein
MKLTKLGIPLATVATLTAAPHQEVKADGGICRQVRAEIAEGCPTKDFNCDEVRRLYRQVCKGALKSVGDVPTDATTTGRDSNCGFSPDACGKFKSG